MSEMNEKYNKVILNESNDLSEFTDYGFESYNEVPSVKKHVNVSEKAYKEIESIRSETGQTQGAFCGNILIEAVSQGFKPISSGVQKNYKISMATEKQVVCYIKESDNEKLNSLATSLNMKVGDYIRLCLYSALKGWKQNKN